MTDPTPSRASWPTDRAQRPATKPVETIVVDDTRLTADARCPSCGGGRLWEALEATSRDRLGRAFMTWRAQCPACLGFCDPKDANRSGRSASIERETITQWRVGVFKDAPAYRNATPDDIEWIAERLTLAATLETLSRQLMAGDISHTEFERRAARALDD